MAKNILRVDSSIRQKGSYSRSLTDRLINQISTTDKDKITIRDLSNGISLIDEQWGQANFTAIEERTDEQKTCLLASDLLVAELADAEKVVIGLPIYNFGLPAAFKAWLDQVIRAKLTFKYTEQGPVGLLKNKKVYIIITSGGTKLGSELDFISAYLRHTFSFIGLTDITFIDSSGLGKNETQVLSSSHKFIEQI